MSKTWLQLAVEREICGITMCYQPHNYQLQLDRILANYEAALFALRTVEAQSTAPKPDYIENGTVYIGYLNGGWPVHVAITIDGTTGKPKSVELVK